MVCKYCHLTTHVIDKCPTIICKNCKEIGHPQWLCKQKKINYSNPKSNMEKKYNFSDEIKKTNVSNICQVIDIKKPVIEKVIQKNINYNLKIEKQPWGNF